MVSEKALAKFKPRQCKVIVSLKWGLTLGPGLRDRAKACQSSISNRIKLSEDLVFNFVPLKARRPFLRKSVKSVELKKIPGPLLSCFRATICVHAIEPVLFEAAQLGLDFVFEKNSEMCYISVKGSITEKKTYKSNTWRDSNPRPHDLPLSTTTALNLRIQPNQ